MEKYKNSRSKTMYLKYQLQREMGNLNCLIDQIQYQIFKNILSISALSQFVINVAFCNKIAVAFCKKVSYNQVSYNQI